MAIVCGTDFSEPSLRAARVAALLAARAHVQLHLVHAVELSSDQIFDEPRMSFVAWAERQLRSAADRLHELGADVQTHLEFGAPDERLQEVASRIAAKLVIVAALGTRPAGRWQLGSNAHRLAHGAQAPVLIVRAPEPFEAWVCQSRPLKILFGADFSLSSEAAARWIGDFTTLGRCEVTAVHLYFPPEQFRRFGLTGVRDYAEPDADVTKALARDFSTRLSPALGAAPFKTRLEPHLGRIGHRLAALAIAEQADLVVVGSHDRSAAGRFLHGAVSHDVIERASVSVACIPAPADARATQAPRVGSVLVATDFSATGNSAVPLAYSVVADGGTVHLAHVLASNASTTASDAHVREAARDRLLDLIPRDVAKRGTLTQVHVLESNDPAAAIYQAAERLDASMLCLGTHGRTGIAKVALGSVAQAVLSATHRPVLLARKPIE